MGRKKALYCAQGMVTRDEVDSPTRSARMSQIQTVKEATNIVEIVGERLELQRAGGYHKANCPFHSEKSPSFFVSESMQRYKCFGCGESGDVLTFLEKYEGMTFGEALEYLADRAGITLQKFTPSAQDDERKILLEILDYAKEYYHYLLTEHEAGQPGREYLETRKIKNESVTLFQLGYATEEWEGLFHYLTKKKKYSADLVEKAGLIIKGKRPGSYYDRFRGRLIFPLKNHRGQVVGFSGRVLDPTIKEAKYINSPETTLYHKGEMLFGYSELLQFIRTSKSVIVVEGELDVIGSTQAHVNNIVAVKGSALTADHAKLLSRVAQRVILSLDTDPAGIEATKRAIKILQPVGLELRVAQVPSGKDPDDLVKQDPGLWREAVKKTLSIYAFLIEQALRAHDATTGEGKRQIMQEVGPVLAEMTHAVEQDYYIKLLAEKLSVREELVREDVRRAGTLGEKGYQQASTQIENKTQQQNKPKTKSRRSRLETYLLFLFFQLFLPQHRQLLATSLNRFVLDLKSALERGFEQQVLGRLTEALVDRVDVDKIHQSLEQLAKGLPEDQAALVMDIAFEPKALSQIESVDLDKEWSGIVKQLHDLAIRDRLKSVTARLKEFDTLPELTPEQEDEQIHLLKDVVELSKQVK